ncbi:MAG: hypothetical protein ACRD0A_07145 [Acidimicrobiales bacterium]
MRLLDAARTVEDLLYSDELAALADDPLRDVTVTLTRERSRRWSGRLGRGV